MVDDKPLPRTEEEWKRALTPEQYNMLRVRMELRSLASQTSKENVAAPSTPIAATQMTACPQRRVDGWRKILYVSVKTLSPLHP
jgi:hypothetical protein